MQTSNGCRRVALLSVLGAWACGFSDRANAAIVEVGSRCLGSASASYAGAFTGSDQEIMEPGIGNPGPLSCFGFGYATISDPAAESERYSSSFGTISYTATSNGFDAYGSFFFRASTFGDSSADPRASGRIDSDVSYRFQVTTPSALDLSLVSVRQTPGGYASVVFRDLGSGIPVDLLAIHDGGIVRGALFELAPGRTYELLAYGGFDFTFDSRAAGSDFFADEPGWGIQANVSPIPLPGAAWLLLSGIGLVLSRATRISGNPATG